jgi:hypothetical protein
MRDGALAEAKNMNLSQVIKVGLMLVTVSSAGDFRLYAGSTTYTFEGQGGAGLSILTQQSDGSFTSAPVPPPTSITVTIVYDPDIIFDAKSTSGFTTTYTNPVPLSFTITGTGSPDWPDFATSKSSVSTLVVTAPPPGRGPDSMTIDGFQPPGPGEVPSTAEVQILAPNGTLSSSAQLPATLNAFTAGGSRSFTANYLISRNPYSHYMGTTAGTLNAVPEPAAVVLMLFGLRIVLPGAAVQRLSTAQSRA